MQGVAQLEARKISLCESIARLTQSFEDALIDMSFQTFTGSNPVRLHGNMWALAEWTIASDA